MIQTPNLGLEKYELTDAANLADGYNSSMDTLDKFAGDTTAHFPVKTNDIADNAVTGAKLNNGAVTTDKIVDANVTNAKLQDAAVTTTKIQEAAVTTDKIADANVTNAKLADGCVTTNKLADEVIDSISKSDWTDASAGIYASRVGHIVILTLWPGGDVTLTPGRNSLTMLPSGWRPSRAVASIATAKDVSGQDVFDLVIDTDGSAFIWSDYEDTRRGSPRGDLVYCVA